MAGVEVYTPTPVVWGRLNGRDFWWEPIENRVIYAGVFLELYEGIVCLAHEKLEGRPVGQTANLQLAFEWLAGGELPELVSVN
jgi:hypothetical protein